MGHTAPIGRLIDGPVQHRW